MNNRERAERIWTDLSGRAGCGIDAWEPAIKTECLDMIVAQLDEAVREAMVGAFEGEDCPVANLEREAHLQGVSEGYAAAREQAAGIANSFEPDQCTRAYAEGYNDAIDDASRAIRAMVPPGEGK